MHILGFKVYYKPEVAAGIEIDSNTAEDIAKHGHYVHLYVPKPSRGVSSEIMRSTPKKEQLINDRLNIYRYNMYKEGKSFKQRMIRYCFCSIKQLWFGLRQKQVDLIFAGSTPPFQGVICSWIKKVKKAPFVFNCQDIFPDSMVAAGLTEEGSKAWRLGNIISNITYKAADKIIVISERMKETLIKKGIPSSKIEVVYNWVDTELIHPVDKSCNKLIKELNIPAYGFTVVYAGNLGYAQGIDVILEAAKALTDDDIGFVIFGNGAIENEVKDEIEKKQLKNVHLYPLQKYERVSEVYSIGDACIVSCKKGTGSIAMPSKTWSIMGCGRPIIASFDEHTLLEKIIQDYHCGMFSCAGDSKHLIENIRAMANNGECSKYGTNAREFIINNLTRDKCTGRIINIIEEVFKESKKGSKK